MIQQAHSHFLVSGSDIEFSKLPLAAARPAYYLTFDAVPNDYITLAGLALTRPFTVVAWTKRRVAGVNHGILAGATIANNLYVTNANAIVGRHANALTGNSTVDATVAWSHIAWICRSSVADNKFFRDGVDVTLVVGATNANIGTYTVIGARTSGTTASFDGQLAAIGVAPGELNVAALWAAGTFHKPLDPAVFTHACWNMRDEGGAGTTLIDEAVGNNGTFKAAGEPAWGGLMSVGGPAGWSDS